MPERDAKAAPSALELTLFDVSQLVASIQDLAEEVRGMVSIDVPRGRLIYASLEMIVASAARLDAKLDEFRPGSTETP